MVQLVRETQAETEERVCVRHRRMVLHSRRGAAASVGETALGTEERVFPIGGWYFTAPGEEQPPLYVKRP